MTREGHLHARRMGRPGASGRILTALAGHDVVSVVKRGIYFWLALPLLTVFVMFVLVFGALFIWAREDWRARRNM